MTKAADTPDAAPAVGTDAALEQLLGEVQASATSPLALVKMQMALSDMQELNKLAADEATVAQAQELAKAWVEGDDSLRKAFAAHWVARARSAVKGVENAGERLGRDAGEFYAGTRRGRRKIGMAGDKARVRAEATQVATERSRAAGRPQGTVAEENARAANRDGAVYAAGAGAYRQATSGLRERFRQKGGQMGRKVARGGMVAGAGAAAGGAAYAGSSRWDSSKHNRGNRGQFSR